MTLTDLIQQFWPVLGAGGLFILAGKAWSIYSNYQEHRLRVELVRQVKGLRRDLKRRG